ncbi:alpha/beta hydrolase [Arthrobacter sp. KBS0703]|uniref:alpha/beta fold hydrolase n=1 Tax=Arthrobacter sp. KBS0703 TaxID=1955698 RepID=UPI00098E8CD5|nr:alpha/beta hydrolase [Arthrobacter sp. KBS0703]TSE14681.1 alpha/beta hydrolase [Arthrobacter sp. KBS0703]
MIEHQTSADGTKIAFERTGEGPALIIIGGALNNRRSADMLVPLLAPHFTVFAYDRRGRGDSTDSPPYSPEREIEDLTALIGAAGGSSYTYGHSSGAILALEAAASGAPISKLAAYEPPYLTGQAPDETWEAFRDRVQAAVDAGDRGAAIELFIRHTGSEFDEGMKSMPWWPALLGVAHTLPYDLTLTRDGSVPADRFADINLPALGIYGGASPSWAGAAISAVAAAVPGMKQEKLEGQNHGVAPEAVAPVLIDFFS